MSKDFNRWSKEGFRTLQLPVTYLTLLTLKLRALHIVSSVFLIGTLLFAQVAVNFFHNNHDVHQLKSVTTPLKDGAAGVQKHDEHCKVCSIDFFNHAFINSTLLFVDHPVFITYNVPFNFNIERITIPYSQGRAPPFSLS